ncbi:MAG: TetR/AcrR family transcriptional regulator [Proteobacteria bacterium]|nr:TetR/AcrR family transcriptional regulator [Pseudomonadota bacterium]MBU1612222.1 TetR/AcrR family transcriptional regulator [Pseudomonadota bacterium]
MSGDDRREQISLAALTLAEDGLRGVTIAAVAEAVGLVPSAIYRHFAGRNEMLQGAFDLLRGKTRQNLLRSIADPDPLSGLEGFLRRHLAIILEHRATPRILFSEDIASKDSPFREMLVQTQNAMIQGVMGMMERGQEQGGIRADLPAADLAVLFLGQMLLPAHMYFIRLGDFDLEGQVTRNWECFRVMIAAPGRSS